VGVRCCRLPSRGCVGPMIKIGPERDQGDIAYSLTGLTERAGSGTHSPGQEVRIRTYGRPVCAFPRRGSADDRQARPPPSSARGSWGRPPRRPLHGRPSHAPCARVLRAAAGVHSRRLPRTHWGLSGSSRGDGVDAKQTSYEACKEWRQGSRNALRLLIRSTGDPQRCLRCRSSHTGRRGSGHHRKCTGPPPSTPRSRPRPPPTGVLTTTPRRRTATSAAPPTASTREVKALMAAEDSSPTATFGGGEHNVYSAVGGAKVCRGSAAGGRVPAGDILGSGITRRVGGASLSIPEAGP